MPPSKQLLHRIKTSAARRLIWQYRKATWRYRALPDIIIIGAQKAGTSSLYHYLSQHPQLLPSFRKEVHFFDGGLDPKIDNFELGQSWYRAHFPWQKDVIEGSNRKSFEASPSYIFNPLAPQRIFDLVPNVKIIALLRNPTERTISHYFHEKRANRESLSIYEALQQEETRLECVIRNKDYKNHTFIRSSYKNRGLYGDQLKRYFNCFPSQQILVINSETFYAEPANTLSRVFEFVEVDTGFKIQDLRPRNVATNKSVINIEVYEYLNSYFMPHNQALYELVGENYGW